MKTRTLLLTTILSAGLALGFTPSSAIAETDARDAVHDRNNQVVRNTFGHCVRTQWVSGSTECSGKQAVVKPIHRQIADEDRTVYFEFNKTSLMDSEQRKLDSLSGTLKSMSDISGVTIVGYADRIGSVSYNDRLSQRRAQVVEDYLRKRGYLNTTVAKTRWLGESVPITQCADDQNRMSLISCLQRDRRVTVEITYQDHQ